MEGGLTASDIFKMMTAGLANPTLPGVKEAMSLAKLAATPPDPYGASGDMVKSARKGDYLSALETGFGAIPTTGAIRAYHGSPHSFDRFDMSKIGTGEGAQAYGHGLYFADNEDVAQSYRQALQQVDTAPFDVIGIPPKEWNAARMFAQNMDPKLPDVAARDFAQWTGREFTPELVDAFAKAKKPGHMYEVRINADPEHFIDYDVPLSDQSESVKRALAGLGYDDGRLSDKFSAINPPSAEEAQRYAQSGIPGIKYLDQGSRGAGEGSRNYVVFDDKLIDIMRKYGIVGAAPLAALGISAQPQQTPEM